MYLGTYSRGVRSGFEASLMDPACAVDRDEQEMRAHADGDQSTRDNRQERKETAERTRDTLFQADATTAYVWPSTKSSVPFSRLERSALLLLSQQRRERKTTKPCLGGAAWPHRPRRAALERHRQKTDKTALRLGKPHTATKQNTFFSAFFGLYRRNASSPGSRLRAFASEKTPKRHLTDRRRAPLHEESVLREAKGKDEVTQRLDPLRCWANWPTQGQDGSRVAINLLQQARLFPGSGNPPLGTDVCVKRVACGLHGRSPTRDTAQPVSAPAVLSFHCPKTCAQKTPAVTPRLRRVARGRLCLSDSPFLLENRTNAAGKGPSASSSLAKTGAAEPRASAAQGANVCRTCCEGG